MRNALRTRDDRSKKIRNSPLGAGPRAAATRIRTTSSVLTEGLPGLLPPAGARRDEIGTAGSALGAFLDRWWSADTARWPVFAASDGPRRGIQGYSIGFGDMGSERASRSPSADTVVAEADLPLDWPQSGGIFDVGPRKLRTSDGQASDAEILTSAPRRLS